MRALRLLAAACVVAGAAILLYAIVAGQMSFALAFFFIPVVYGSSLAGGMAIGLIVLGFFLWMADLFARASDHEAGGGPDDGPGGGRIAGSEKEFGGVVLLGPIPIIFGSSSRAALYALVIGALVLVLLLMALFFL